MDESLIASTQRGITKIAKLKPSPITINEAAEDVYFQHQVVMLHPPGTRFSTAPTEVPVEHVFGPLATPDDIWTRNVLPLAQECLDGKDAIFCVVGSDNSGKSFLLNGVKGINQLAIRWLKKKLANKNFGYIARCEEKKCTTTLKISKNHIKIDQNACKMPSKFEIDL